MLFLSALAKIMSFFFKDLPSIPPNCPFKKVDLLPKTLGQSIPPFIQYMNGIHR
ncbi:MAG: hypothetical protein CM1200mP37_5340 [Chloroflexota bacterium]|nr:MAG: hypothetical protein CM1200mP37_5340 [Chloroflexota bacterium]